MYVDDGKLTVSSQSLDTNNYVLDKAYQLVDQWLHSAGLSPDKDKRELMHYTRRKRDEGIITSNAHHVLALDCLLRYRK